MIGVIDVFASSDPSSIFGIPLRPQSVPGRWRYRIAMPAPPEALDLGGVQVVPVPIEDPEAPWAPHQVAGKVAGALTVHGPTSPATGIPERDRRLEGARLALSAYPRIPARTFAKGEWTWVAAAIAELLVRAYALTDGDALPLASAHPGGRGLSHEEWFAVFASKRAAGFSVPDGEGIRLDAAAAAEERRREEARQRAAEARQYAAEVITVTPRQLGCFAYLAKGPARPFENQGFYGSPWGCRTAIPHAGGRLYFFSAPRFIMDYPAIERADGAERLLRPDETISAPRGKIEEATRDLTWAPELRRMVFAARAEKVDARPIAEHEGLDLTHSAGRARAAEARKFLNDAMEQQVWRHAEGVGERRDILAEILVRGLLVPCDVAGALIDEALARLPAHFPVEWRAAEIGKELRRAAERGSYLSPGELLPLVPSAPSEDAPTEPALAPPAPPDPWLPVVGTALAGKDQAPSSDLMEAIEAAGLGPGAWSREAYNRLNAVAATYGYAKRDRPGPAGVNRKVFVVVG